MPKPKARHGPTDLSQGMAALALGHGTLYGDSTRRFKADGTLGCEDSLESGEVAKVKIAIKFEIERLAPRVVGASVWAGHAASPVEEVAQVDETVTVVVADPELGAPHIDVIT